MWPLARWGLPTSALVIGSVTPDIFMMLPIPAVVHFAHTPRGLVTADLAIGVAAFYAWQDFYRPAVFAIVVGRGKEAIYCPWWTVTLAVLLGATTHLLWDSFTHDWMWGPQHLAWLAERHGPLLGWQWVQRVSDVVGLAIVAAWVLAWWRKAPVASAGPDALAGPDASAGPDALAGPDAAQRPNGMVRLRVLALLAILGPAAIAFCVLLLRDSFYVAITTAAGVGVIGMTIVAEWVKP